MKHRDPGKGRTEPGIFPWSHSSLIPSRNSSLCPSALGGGIPKIWQEEPWLGISCSIPVKFPEFCQCLGYSRCPNTGIIPIPSPPLAAPGGICNHGKQPQSPGKGREHREQLQIPFFLTVDPGWCCWGGLGRQRIWECGRSRNVADPVTWWIQECVRSGNAACPGTFRSLLPCQG